MIKGNAVLHGEGRVKRAGRLSRTSAHWDSKQHTYPQITCLLAPLKDAHILGSGPTAPPAHSIAQVLVSLGFF